MLIWISEKMILFIYFKTNIRRIDGFKEIVLESYPTKNEEGDWSRNKGFSSDINGKCSERICNRYMEDPSCEA